MESLIFWNPKRRPLRIVRCFACKRPFMRGSLNKLHPGLRTLDSRILNSFRLIARPTPPYPTRPVHDFHHFRLDYKPTSWRGYSPSFVASSRYRLSVSRFALTLQIPLIQHGLNTIIILIIRRETGLSTNSFHGYKEGKPPSLVVVVVWNSWTLSSQNGRIIIIIVETVYIIIEITKFIC